MFVVVYMEIVLLYECKDELRGLVNLCEVVRLVFRILYRMILILDNVIYTVEFFVF